VKKNIILTIDFVGKEVFEPISQIENNKPQVLMDFQLGGYKN
jgi:hypothetical protein